MGGPRSIFVIEDEPDIRALLVHHLGREGLPVRAFAEGTSALAEAAAEPPLLVLLDLNLPGLPGTEVCRRLRATPCCADVPVVILSARAEEIDRVVGFEIGADDYVTKPFSGRELMLRVGAILRRTAAAHATSQPRRVRGLEIDPAGYRVRIDGADIALTLLEFKLLAELVRRAGRVTSRGQLLQEVWGASPELDTRTVDTHVKRLRSKLGRLRDCVVTLRGVGYRFEPPVEDGRAPPDRPDPA